MLLIVGITVALLLLIGALTIWLISRGNVRREARGSAPLLVFMPAHEDEPLVIRPPPPAATPPHRDVADALRSQLRHDRPVVAESSAPMPQAEREPVAVAGGQSSVLPPASSESVTIAFNRRRTSSQRTSADSAEAMGTLRVLPGRLVPQDRSLVRDDIRFIALDGMGKLRYTLGRSDGPLHEHIQIDSPTVSRQHAAVVFAGGSWTIGNLSDTNPVRVNGVEIPESATVPLADGDLVEMGEVVLEFRS